MTLFPILLGKTVTFVSKKLNRAGSTWPGHIALKLESNFVSSIMKKNPQLKIVLIAGTNGKTTTTKLIQEVLEKEELKVFRNEAGANLLNGVASSLVKVVNINGKIPHDVALFEVDENSLPLVLDEIKPNSIILLNLFRDQLDRYGEVNSISKKWLESISKLSRETLLVVNGDDPMLRYIGEKSNLTTSYFGISEKYMEKKNSPHDSDFLFCPKCKTELTYSTRSYSHMGKFKCPGCGYENKNTQTFDNLPNPMHGNYNKYNINAAALLLKLGFGLNEKTVENALVEFLPAFGRQEQIEYNGKNIFLLLSKNPTGFNQSIQAILEKENQPNILLLLNDRIPDGRDVSWIWDVDFEEVKKAKSITVSGDRTYDMALRMKYAIEAQNSKIKSQNLNSKFKTEENLKNGIDQALDNLSDSETLFILATYSAMLEARKILTGKQIL